MTVIPPLHFSLSLSQQTPMHTAAKDGNEYTMKGLVKLGADINIKDNEGVRKTNYYWKPPYIVSM